MSTTDVQLSFGRRIGVFILAEISAVSASSVILLLGYIAVRCPESGRLIDMPTHQALDSIARSPFGKARGVGGD
jgi:hypothetical protein